MKTPKARGETADQKATRLAEEQRIKVMQMRADADEQAAGRRLLTKKTRAVMRIFGARTAMVGVANPSGGGNGGGVTSGGVNDGGAYDYPLGYEGGFTGGGRTFKAFGTI